MYHSFIERWKDGLETGKKGSTGTSSHIRRYLIETYGERCIICGWAEIHPITGKVPVELDHINGNSDDNRENNVRLLCPNHHSLTSTFRNLNRGNGRKSRRMPHKHT